MTTPAPTLNAWLDEWLALQRSQLKPSTIKSYTATARAYLRPTLGTYRLDELTTRLITRAPNELMPPSRRGGRHLSARTDEEIHSVLHEALRDAVPATTVARALLDARPLIIRSRLIEAARQARERGLLLDNEYGAVMDRLDGAEWTAWTGPCEPPGRAPQHRPTRPFISKMRQCRGVAAQLIQHTTNRDFELGSDPVETTT